jgi:hypothetical protein
MLDAATGFAIENPERCQGRSIRPRARYSPAAAGPGAEGGVVVCDGGAAQYATRYRSVAAWELQRKGKRVGEWVGLVAHEHVWTRATCRIRLLSAPDATAIEAIVSALQGCVVTKAEHQRLKPFDATHEGWARYIAAGVPVIDTSTGNHADLSALEAGSD